MEGPGGTMISPVCVVAGGAAGCCTGALARVGAESVGRVSTAPRSPERTAAAATTAIRRGTEDRQQ